MRQKAFRLYPIGYTGNSLGELNSLLQQGWLVKISLPEVTVERYGSSHTHHVLILEKMEENSND